MKAEARLSADYAEGRRFSEFAMYFHFGPGDRLGQFIAFLNICVNLRHL